MRIVPIAHMVEFLVYSWWNSMGGVSLGVGFEVHSRWLNHLPLPIVMIPEVAVHTDHVHLQGLGQNRSGEFASHTQGLFKVRIECKCGYIQDVSSQLLLQHHASLLMCTEVQKSNEKGGWTESDQHGGSFTPVILELRRILSSKPD